MKTIKISLAVIVVGIIAFFIANSLIFSQEMDKIPPAENQFTKYIEQQIITLEKLPENKFNNIPYNDANYQIDDYHLNKRLGKNKLENDQWKDILSKNLYAVYTGKFIKQAYYVFNRNDWSLGDINFIRKECTTLRKSEFLEKGSPVDNSLAKIQQILGKYDEVNAFIAYCKGFSYTDYSFNSSFPLSTVKQKIARAELYKNNKLENNFVNNCFRLHNQMNDIKQSLFNAHYRYLENKFKNWQDLYSEYTSFNEYKNNLLTPLSKELDLIDNDLYNVRDFDNKFDSLYNLLTTDSRNAYKHLSK
jgi:hypothetical protein